MHNDEILRVARLCHEANKLWCEFNGDMSQPTWDNAPDWQKESAIKGVEFHLDMYSKNKVPQPNDSHDSWVAQKLKDGWVYGEVKDPEAKTHPCLVPFESLPMAQQIKDFVFMMFCTAGLGVTGQI